MLHGRSGHGAAESVSLPHATLGSGCWPALSDGIGYPLGTNVRFQVDYRILPPHPGFAWRRGMQRPHSPGARNLVGCSSRSRGHPKGIFVLDLGVGVRERSPISAFWPPSPPAPCMAEPWEPCLRGVMNQAQRVPFALGRLLFLRSLRHTDAVQHL